LVTEVTGVTEAAIVKQAITMEKKVKRKVVSRTNSQAGISTKYELSEKE